MSKFKIIETPIRGLLIIEPTIQSDKRGFSMNTDSKQELIEIGIESEFVQENSFKVARGILKGLHFQREQTQGVLIRVEAGAILVVAVDLRPTSKTYGASWSVGLSADRERLLWIPEQFAHGFVTIENNTEIVFKCTDYDKPESVSGIIWDDPILCIDWQFDRYEIDEKYLRVSDRDKNLPAFRTWKPNEIWNREIEV